MRISDWSSDVCSSDLTERPFTSPLNDEHRAGTFACAGCALPLYSSKTKFESHTGWPSFWAPLKGAVATATDRHICSLRTEVHYRLCGDTIGQLLKDGPKHTGKQYSMNGTARSCQRN